MNRRENTASSCPAYPLTTSPAGAPASAQQKVAADGPAEPAASAGFVRFGAGSR
ncbi:hypothetical protein QRX60_22940 [Amycolatopsis mongoliensis]|uniref:Uncharacterized protein n=1 Tax=Amycolatopsis mongoliensis TaxID=715475 RepID=A0A9Y2JZL6_9PSEU|nr:hypothetical protein [Amycolatopsis sp. 4-36]WIY06564.1 hypothetical protein QRX60_22940 [Amycolatopsis sp. 4-36]